MSNPESEHCDTSVEAMAIQLRARRPVPDIAEYGDCYHRWFLDTYIPECSKSLRIKMDQDLSLLDPCHCYPDGFEQPIKFSPDEQKEAIELGLARQEDFEWLRH